MAATTYGGQAVIEGVVIRGRRTLAMACRRPNGEIYRYREALDSSLSRSPLARLPLVRGVVVLGETLSDGIRLMLRSADIQMEAEPQATPGAGATAGLVALTIAFALLVFVGIPYAATQLLQGLVSSTVVLNLIEGLIRGALLLGYIVGISFLRDIQRVFAYHGAEHMTIHAFEHDEPLDADHIQPYPTAHPRCGTAFLLLVVLVAVLVFAFMPRASLVLDLVARLLLVVPVAAIAYELLKLGAAHEGNAVVRALVAPGLILQRLTTRRPDRSMIEIAVASLQEALAGDAEGAE